ncbi:transcriptional regulator LeuO [Enterovibrio nigricans]|uniref:LysR family transcriptional regulator, transcriptional activator for leuABCD operon n=1 Tax=Enterovibrio nigricans DSM 22720 TaxID=1121868 RepID=A0A1T4U2D4_9GAMM|nr:transcriptional regulator LeuO [Enterovibrio nigricans]SKA46691.1 LysR family transcriptional regulator, transcriptional activator for leuABCD operon [Enterovibrio nigricans DSM 22720]
MTQKESVQQLDDRTDLTLRSVDLNLITVFDAVMQEQNITRAAQSLGMSQPAVSNAVSRLKVMFNDELFVRNGRGIKPTQRARQLFGPIRQAIQLIKNELPTSIFVPETSTRTFRLAICSPSDMRFAPQILNTINQLAPSVKVQVETEFNRDIANKLRYQEVDFVVDYLHFGESGFCSTEMFNDELVVVANKHHPRLGDAITAKELQNEAHAVLKRNGEMQGYAEVLYRDGRYREAYQGVSLSNILYVVSQSALIAVAPRWMVESGQYRENLKTLPLPSENNRISGYLSWHASAEKDKGHLWMRDQLLSICGNSLV